MSMAIRRVYALTDTHGATYRPMASAKRYRDRDKAALFAEISSDLVNRVDSEATVRGVNKWEVVEEALRKGLPLLSPSAAITFEDLARRSA